MLSKQELKNNWTQSNAALPVAKALDEASFQKIIVSRTRQQRHVSMQYFWASFILQMIVYAMLSHVAIKHGSDTAVLGVAAACALLYLPFTVMLLRKFKQLAVLKLDQKHTAGVSMYDYVARQRALLASFYKFKKTYEFILIPLSSAILIWIFFRIYLPGGVMAYPVGASICFVVTLVACIAAIIAENKKRFEEPLAHLKEILRELEQ